MITEKVRCGIKRYIDTLTRIRVYESVRENSDSFIQGPPDFDEEMERLYDCEEKCLALGEQIYGNCRCSTSWEEVWAEQDRRRASVTKRAIATLADFLKLPK